MNRLAKWEPSRGRGAEYAAAVGNSPIRAEVIVSIMRLREQMALPKPDGCALPPEFYAALLLE